MNTITCYLQHTWLLGSYKRPRETLLSVQQRSWLCSWRLSDWLCDETKLVIRYNLFQEQVNLRLQNNTRNCLLIEHVVVCHIRQMEINPCNIPFSIVYFLRLRKYKRYCFSFPRRRHIETGLYVHQFFRLSFRLSVFPASWSIQGILIILPVPVMMGALRGSTLTVSLKSRFIGLLSSVNFRVSPM